MKERRKEEREGGREGIFQEVWYSGAFNPSTLEAATQGSPSSKTSRTIERDPVSKRK